MNIEGGRRMNEVRPKPFTAACFTRNEQCLKGRWKLEPIIHKMDFSYIQCAKW